MKKIILAISILCYVALSSMAQTKTYSGVKQFYPSALRTIVDNNEIKGYCMFACLDKVTKKENIYQLLILDNLLNETHAIEMKKSTTFGLIESSFNGERFCFMFMDQKEKIVEYLLVDKSGKQTGNYRVEDLSPSEMGSLLQMTQGTLAPIDGKGFVRYGIEKEKGYKVALEMISNDGKKLWSAGSGVPKGDKSYETAVPYYSDSNYLISGISIREKMLSTDGEINVVCHDATNGKEVFKVSNKHPKYNLLTEGVSYDETSGDFYIFGAYAKPKDIVSLGIFIQVVDKNGVVKKESFSAWAKEILTATPAAIKSKMEKNMFIALHEIVRTADGRIFAIGEQFHKGVSGLGVATQLMGGGGVALTKIELFNMMVYEFDSEIKIKTVHMFEKDKTNVQLPQGIGVNGSTTIGYYLKLTGQFDYAYTSVSADKKTFNVAYLNYDKDKEEGNKFVVGNITNTATKLVQDKIDLPSKASNFWIRPAKPGYVCIFEYFKKTKKLTIRLEKLNV